MKWIGGIVLVAFLLLAVSGYALPSPTIQFIPDTFSENGSFLAVADPGMYDDSIRITWISPGISETDLGLFPRTGDKWACYFSNIDKDAPCGPTPFTSYLTSYDMVVMSVDSAGNKGNKTVAVNVGSIRLTPEITVQGSKIIMVIYTSESAENVTYAIFDSNFDMITAYTPLTKSPYGNYNGEATLGATGIYYLALKAENSALGTYGGEVKKIQIGSTLGGGFVSGDLETDPVVFSVLMNKSQVYKRTNYNIRNIGTKNLTGLKTQVDPEITGRVGILLEKDSLKVNESAYFTVELKNMSNGLSIITAANITSNGTVVGQIPLYLNVSVLNECEGSTGPCTCPPCPGGGAGTFTITPATWSDDFLIGEPSTKNFTITNTGDADLTFTGSNTGSLGSSATVNLPGTISPGSTGQLSISLSPFSSGSYSGIVTITANAGSQSIVVSTSFYSDITNDIEDALARLTTVEYGVSAEQAIELAGLFETVKTGLESAESDMGFGNYEYANSEYESAIAKLEVLEDFMGSGVSPGNGGSSPSSGGTGDLMIPILIVALVVLGGVFVYLKKFRGSGGGGGDEEFEEEFNDEEGY